MAAACRPDRHADLATLGDLPPLHTLRGIALGMQATAFHATRPTVSFAPSVGYREQIDGFVIAYGFDGATTTDVPEGATLRYVTAARPTSSVDEARERWQALVTSTRQRLGAPDACWTDRPLSLPRHAVGWIVGDSELQIAYLVPSDAAGPAPAGQQPAPRVQIQVGRPDAATRTSRIPESCQ